MLGFKITLLCFKRENSPLIVIPCSPALLFLVQTHTTAEWTPTLLTISAAINQVSICDEIHLLYSGSLGSFYFNAPFFFQTSLRSHHRQNSFFGFIFSLFEHSFLVCVTARRRTLTERACCLNASFLGCQEPTSSAQQLGPPHFLVAYDRSNTNSHFRILFCSISPTEQTFKRSVHLADLTQASLYFSPRLSPLSWHGSWPSRSSTETSHHRSLTRA